MIRTMVREFASDERLDVDERRDRAATRTPSSATPARLENGKIATDDVGLDAVARTHLANDADLVEMAKTDWARAYRTALSRAGESFADVLPSRELPTLPLNRKAALSQQDAEDEAIHRRATEIQARDGVTYSEALRRHSDEVRAAYYARQQSASGREA